MILIESAVSVHEPLLESGGCSVSEVAPLADVRRLSFNQATAEKSSLREVIESCARHEVPSISIWRHKLAELGVAEAARLVRDAGIAVSSV